MSKRSKKFRMKKPLSEAELERRKILREKRKERESLTSINSRRRFWRYFFLIFAVIGIGIASAVFDSGHASYTFVYYIGILIFAGIICCDNSGLRTFLFGRLSDNFPFSEELKRPVKGLCRVIESCKTLSYFSVLFYIFSHRLEALWVAIWIICEIVTIVYLIFDKDTALRPKETPENGLSSAGDITVFTSLCMFVLNLGNFFPDRKLFIFTGLFTLCGTVMYMLISAEWQTKKDRIFLFIIGAATFSFSGFCTVNRTFDFSDPKVYTAVIENKNYSSGKYKHYDFYVEDWNNTGETIDVEVNAEDYRNAEIGDTVTIYEYSGALGMKYYKYSLEQEE